MNMALLCKQERFKINDMTICGEISTLFSVGRKEFFLNCKFCDNTYLQLNNFVSHICEDHMCQLTNQLSNELTLELKEETQCSDEIITDPIKLLDVDQEENDIKEIGMGGVSPKNTFCEELFSGLSFEAADYTDPPVDIKESNAAEECNQFEDCSVKTCKRKDRSQDTNKQFTIELIKLYHNLPALWNINLEAYTNAKLQQEQLEILLEKYRERYPTATKEDLKKKIHYLCKQFRRELERVEPSGTLRPYYFDEMQFLKDILPPSHMPIEHINWDVLEDTQQNSTGFPIPGSSLNDSQAINLAEIYKKHTCLWDFNDITYGFANRRQEALDNILSEFQSTSGLTTLTKKLLEKEILRLRKVGSTEKKKKIACKQSDTPFKSTSMLYNHIAYLEDYVAPYECSICGDVISAWTIYKKHVSLHDGTQPFKCQICGHGFVRPTNLTIHLRAHVQEFRFFCEVCSKPYTTKNQLETHMRTHTGEKPFVCHYCGKRYRFKSGYLGHIRRHEKNPRHKCDICSKLFYNSQMLKEHTNAHLQIRNYICNVCEKGFTCAKLLRQHKQIHNKDKKYLCKICDKRFAQAAGLNSHLKSHGTQSSNI